MPAGKANLFWWVTVVLAMLVSISLSLRLSVSHCCVAESVDSVERFQMELYAGQARPSAACDHWKRRLMSSMVYNMPRTKASLSNCTDETCCFLPKTIGPCAERPWAQNGLFVSISCGQLGGKGLFLNASLAIDFEGCCFVLSFTLNTRDCKWKITSLTFPLLSIE